MFPVLFVFKYGHLVKSCLHFKFLIYIFLIFKVTIFRKKEREKCFVSLFFVIIYIINASYLRFHSIFGINIFTW